MRFGILALMILGCRTADDPKTTLEEPEVVDADGDGFSIEDGDCDDSDAQVSPNASEICDGFDNNCDGEIDESVTQTFYEDLDGDGFGDQESSVQSCDIVDGFVVAGNDCDDLNPDSYPSAEELCDGVDNDCDEEIDEDVGSLFYLDNDGDGVGNSEETVTQCDPDLGLASVGGDCDDNDPMRTPNAYEICDGIDNDCDEDVDEGALTTFYWDGDEDGFGDATQPIEDCTQQQYYALNSEDCNDIDATINPLADEVCDEEDNDCDGFNNEQGSIGESVWYLDQDGDGFGDVANPTILCDLPTGYVENYDDCDDTNAQTSPNAFEICDSVDNNCDGLIDESGATGESAYFADLDNDGQGDPNNSVMSCSQPNFYTLDSLDCDDSNATIYTGATEVCDGLDNDCDGSQDNNAIDIVQYYIDADGDGYGGIQYEECTPPTDAMYVGGDCDDGDSTLNLDDLDSDGFSTCDSDCNDLDATFIPVDLDGDGYSTCDGDCDDSDIGLEPADVDGDGYSTCDGDCDDGDSILTPEDLDTDGYSTCDGDCDDFDSSANLDDADGDGYSSCNGDCNDGDALLTPVDGDGDGYSTCDGDCDDSDIGLEPADLDGDGFSTCDGDCDDGDASANLDDLDSDGYSTCDGDCNDLNAVESPVGIEDCGDGFDNDCNGIVDDLPVGSFECAATSCSEVSGSGLFYVDQGNGPDWYYCENDTDDGGWTLAYWVSYDHHPTTGETSRSSLGDLSTHAKLSDSEIQFIATNGASEVMIKDHHSSTIYIEGYSSWGTFSSTGWTNEPFLSKDSSGNWISGCNGHRNNRGISTYSDNAGNFCPTTFQGIPKYFVTWHTSNYVGGVGGEYGVYVR